MGTSPGASNFNILTLVRNRKGIRHFLSNFLKEFKKNTGIAIAQTYLIRKTLHLFCDNGMQTLVIYDDLSNRLLHIDKCKMGIFSKLAQDPCHFVCLTRFSRIA